MFAAFVALGPAVLPPPPPPPPPPPRDKADERDDTSTPALAEPEPEPGKSGREPSAFDGGYLFVDLPAPVFTMQIPGESAGGVSWGLHGGYSLSAGHARAAVGLGLKHAYIPRYESSLVRVMAEARLGGGNGRVFGYGKIGVGYGADTFYPASAFAFDLGGGVQGRIGKRLLLGAEATVFGGIAGPTPGIIGMWQVNALVGVKI
jgi:hypothetical protein